MANVIFEILDGFFFGMSTYLPAFKIRILNVILNFELE